MRTFEIMPTDKRLAAEVQAKIDNLNKPKGSLGRLEETALQLCLIQGTTRPQTGPRWHLLLGGDHGIEREGVSVSPREVTWQQMVNFTRGGGGVNMFCRQHGFGLKIVDVGVDHDLSGVAGIVDRKIARGTRNFLHEAAMTVEQMDRAIETGCSLVDQVAGEGCRLLSIGEMGIGNTSPSAIWMSLLCDIPLGDCIGAGAGLDDRGLAHKQRVLECSVERFLSEESAPRVTDVMRQFGGFEMVAAIGAMLRGAEHRMTILIDGFIMTACALCAIRLYPAAQDYMIFGHCGDESGHRRLLEAMGARPLLSLGLRLGEGTGALCAFPIVDSAARMVNEMNSFDNANITKYF